MSRSGRPEDVVLEGDVLAVAGDLNGIRVQLHHRVVGQAHGAAGALGVVQLDASTRIVVDQVVGNQIGPAEGLGQYAGHVVVALVAEDADVGGVQEDAGGVSKGPAVSQRAAAELVAGGVAPGFAVAQNPVEAGGVEAGGVVVGFVVEVLAPVSDLEAHAAVAIGKVVVEQAIDAGGGVINKEAIGVVPGHVAGDFEAGGVDRQAGSGVIPEEVVLDGDVGADVLQVDAVVGPAVVVVGLIAQDGGVLASGEDAKVLVAVGIAGIAEEEIIPDDGGAAGRVVDVQAGIGIIEDRRVLNRQLARTVVHENTFVGAGDRQVAEGDTVGIVQFDAIRTGGDVSAINHSPRSHTGEVVGGNSIGREDLVVNRSLIDAAGPIGIGRSIALADVIARASDVAEGRGGAAAGESPVGIDLHVAGRGNRDDEMSPAIGVEDAAKSQASSCGGAVVGLNVESINRR